MISALSCIEEGTFIRKQTKNTATKAMNSWKIFYNYFTEESMVV